MLYIQNATIFTPGLHFDDGALLIERDRIIAVGPSKEVDCPVQAEVIDASELLLVPGFINLQVNGAFGHDFTINPDTIWPVAADFPRYGVTSFLPTIITSPLETIATAQRILARGPTAEWHGVIPLGLHVEGPFLNPAKKGAIIRLIYTGLAWRLSPIGLRSSAVQSNGFHWLLIGRGFTDHHHDSGQGSGLV